MISERSYEIIRANDLHQLLEGSIKILDDYYMGKGRKWLEWYNIKQPLCVALCQGAAMHYYDHNNGVKDFDVWFFYPFKVKHLPYRDVRTWIYKNDKFGGYPGLLKQGRNVDVLVRSLREYDTNDPIATLLNYLESGKTKTARELSKKAVVMLEPEESFGQTIWYKTKI